MGGVNPVLGARIGEAVGQFAGEGRTVIVVEHNLPLIEKTCDRVVVMDLGEVIATGPFSACAITRGWSTRISEWTRALSEPAVAASPEAVLRAEGVTAGYGGPPIIEDVSITVYAKKITAIVGPNGAGKSTLLKALSGVLKVSGGSVSVLGQNTTASRRRSWSSGALLRSAGLQCLP